MVEIQRRPVRVSSSSNNNSSVRRQSESADLQEKVRTSGHVFDIKLVDEINNNLLAEHCSRCQRSFPREGVMVLEAMGRVWHIECFRWVFPKERVCVVFCHEIKASSVGFTEK